MRIAVFDVGGTFIKYSLMFDDVMTKQGKVSTPHESQDTFLETIEQVLKQLGEVEGIAFSLPGVINVDQKYILAGGSLTYNNQTDVRQWEARFGLPIEIENAVSYTHLDVYKRQGRRYQNCWSCSTN